MNYYRCLVIVIPVIFVTGCGADDKTNAADTAETSKYIIPDAPGQSLNIDSNKNTATIPATGTQPVAIAAPAITGLNPAHGQPGHRCDIAVGAPLDSKPNSTAPITTVSQPSQTNNTTQPLVNTSTATAPVSALTKGVNPAHGQPGHRCDIAVGAALDSKPIPATTTSPNLTTTAQKSAFSPLPVTPVIPVNNTTSPAVAAGMNPAHGQPGHRCDIAVGAPLNDKPKQ
ncbi:MAG TPA: hypothetical protein VF487_16905 [Chitinophagaceae bacterium]